MSTPEPSPLVIIGAGQAGLTLGRRLQQTGAPFVILEGKDRVGDVWRHRWASLQLFTLPRHTGLPDRPLRGRQCLTGQEFADYLERYTADFELPVRTGVRVDRVRRTGDDFELVTTAGQIVAEQVVIATGPYRHPHTPAFAAELDPSISQLHSVDYRGPEQLADGDVLVVGAANSGSDLALEAVRSGHRTWLAGRHPGQLPVQIDSALAPLTFPLVQVVFQKLLTLDQPWGRGARNAQRRSAVPLVRHSRRELIRAGVHRVGRIDRIEDGLPVTADGERLTPATVLWCTGYRPDFGWLDLGVPDLLDERGEPRHTRGVTDVPGLYVLGLEFLYSAGSATIQGVDGDARFLARQLQPA